MHALWFWGFKHIHLLSSKGSSPTHVSTEELSVYDIKDHPDYKFRPGHVVVRVAAGPDDPDVIDVSTPRNQSCTAAGQVLSLGTDGRLKIQWADGSTSFCYPQELYLLSDEVSTSTSPTCLLNSSIVRACTVIFLCSYRM